MVGDTDPKPPHNIGPIKSILSKNKVNHGIEWSLNLQKLDQFYSGQPAQYAQADPS